jgi:hypothetical protein
MIIFKNMVSMILLFTVQSLGRPGIGKKRVTSPACVTEEERAGITGKLGILLLTDVQRCSLNNLMRSFFGERRKDF